uniref:Transcription initiation factor IIA subunit 1 n=1 Tax=Syphacia muris TaxID=451379 RepID=A0A0N5AAX2_9BILA
MTQQQGSSIAEIYKGVISDVISQVKEAFLDENVDVEQWEEKLIRSGSVDFEAPKPPQPPQIRQVKTSSHMINATPQAIPAGSAVRIAQNGQHILVQQSMPSQVPQQTVVMQTGSGQSMQRQIQQVQYINTGSIPLSTETNVLQQAVQVRTPQRQQVGQSASQTIAAPIQSGMIFHSGQGARIVNQGGQQYIVHGTAPNLTPGSSVMLVNANGQQIPVTLGSTAMLQPSRIPPSQINPKVEGVPQLDGAGEIDAQPGSSECLTIASGQKKSSRVVLLPQLDGTGRISDSSSDEEDVDDDEDDDPYRRIADQIDDDANGAEDEEQVCFC